MNKKIISLCIASSILFSACGSSSNRAVDGYNAFVNKQQEYYVSIGGNKDTFKGKGGSYVWIQGDGTIEAGTTKDTIWYKINYAINTGTRETSFITFAVLSQGASVPVELDSNQGSTSYSYALSLVRDGSLKGEIGNL